jgi:hypothetical protein
VSAVAVSPGELAGTRVRALHVVFAAYVVSALFHVANSFWHVTPAIYIDELLYSQLAQSLAAGDGLTVRGEPVFFPGLLPVLLQAPAWLIPDMGVAYAVVKTVNALVMAAAVFPAYWLARQVVSSARLAVAAAALVAVSPALIYHSYLMSEALALPVFLACAATMTRALARPSRRWELAVVGTSLLAVTTRVQLVALPVAYVVAACVSCGGVRGALRAHRLSVGAFGAAGVVGAATGGVALGPYVGAALLDYHLADLLRWGGYSALLVPFGWAWFLAPGALLGWATLRRSAFGVLAGTFTLLTLVEITLVAGGQAERPLERYAIYLAPLAFVCFLAYAERGAPWRRAYIALASAFGLGAWLVPFPSLAPGIRGYNFSFDSPTLSAYGPTAMWLGHPNAATIFCGAGFLGCAAAVALAWKRRSPVLLVAPALLVLALSTVAAYAGDRAMTRGARDSWAPAGFDWIDRAGLGTVDYVVMPGASPHYAYLAEAWNRSFGEPLLLGVPDPDPFADRRLNVGPDGRLRLDGAAPSARSVAVNQFASRLELAAPVTARAGDTVVYRIGPDTHARALAFGLYADGWAGGSVRYQAWSTSSEGRYVLRLELPRGMKARTATLEVADGARRVVRLRPGSGVDVSLPAAGRPLPVLRIRTDRADSIGAYSQNPRLVGVRIPHLRYVASTQGRA